MNQAQYIVAELLEIREATVAFGGEFARILLGPRRWRNFWDVDAHGVFRFKERVADADYADFCADIEQLRIFLRMNNIVVPKERWVLKMPKGYGILGRDVMGNSVLGRNDVVALGVELVDNPLMSEQENARWKKGL